MNNYINYEELIKPFFAPPAFLFGPVWSLLYFIIFVSFGFLFYKFYKKEISKSLIIFVILNLFFNFIFTPIQFGLKNLFLSSIDILLVLATLFMILHIIKKDYKKFIWVFYINILYFLWVCFATMLQISITILNW